MGPWIGWWSVGVALGSPTGQPVNGHFEDGATGSEPTGWQLSGGGQAVVQLEDPFEGSQSVLLSRGRLSQEWSADNLSGQAARVRLHVRPKPDSTGQVQLVARAGGERVWQTRVQVREAVWSSVVLEVELPATDEVQLSLSIALIEGSGLQVDAVEVSDPGALVSPEAAPLAADAAARIVAFSKLYARVRWFHPADETLAADWDAIAQRGVALAEQTSDPQALAGAWMDLLQPVAPTVQIWSETAPSTVPSVASDRRVGWYHLGPAVSLATSESSAVSAVHGVGSTFRRFRVDDAGDWLSELQRTVSIAALDAREWQGETVRLAVDASVEGALDAAVQLKVSGSERASVTPSLRDGPAELLLRVPPGAEGLEVSLLLSGPGAIELTRLGIAPVRVSPLRRAVTATGLIALFSSVVGVIALVGAIVTRRTIGGFIIALATLGLLVQLAQLDPDIARWLPFIHIENLEGIGFEDADTLGEVTRLLGAPVRAETSLGVVCAWVVGLLALGATRLQAMDIRGGGD